MPNDLLIEKSDTTEAWNADHALGTLILSGVGSDLALHTIETATALFKEFAVERISSASWVLLSEELRRGNLGAAVELVKALPRRAPDTVAFTEEGSGEDPRDIPPPTLFGEELEQDLQVPPVYIVSDFHIGSTRLFSQTDKSKSNDMSEKTLALFLAWMRSVDQDARDYEHYDVIMNGDFIDLWQAKRPENDSGPGRLEDVIQSNSWFFEDLGKYLRSKYPRCRFYYLVGNHDDFLYNSADGSHYATRQQLTTALREEHELVLVPGLGQVKRTHTNAGPMPFAINLRYTNSAYQLLVEHGHQYDAFNWKGNDDAAVGQGIAEFINHMQERDSAFAGLEYTPNQETVKYLACLKANPNTPQAVRDLVSGMQNKAISSAFSNSFFGAIADGINYLMQGDNSVLDHPEVHPDKVRKGKEKAARDLMDQAPNTQPVKIVVFGHTHLRDLQPVAPESDWAYANTGTWMNEIRAGKGANGCSLAQIPSPLPYVKISRQRDANKALVELKAYRGNLADRLVRVQL